VASSSSVPGEIGEPRGPPWPAARVALSRATRHHLLIRGHLRVLGDERDPICSFTVVETSHKKWSTGRRLSRRLATVKASFGEASASRSSPASLSRPTLSPRLLQWLQSMKTTQIWWRLGFGRFRVLRAKICVMGCAIYMSF
jgi:hypothetical protein